MARKKEEPNYIEELAERFERWDDVYQNGCHDPTWSDGVNLNLIRNYILYYKGKIEKSVTDGKFPDIQYIKKKMRSVDEDFLKKNSVGAVK